MRSAGIGFLDKIGRNQMGRVHAAAAADHDRSICGAVVQGMRVRVGLGEVAVCKEVTCMAARESLKGPRAQAQLWCSTV